MSIQIRLSVLLLGVVSSTLTFVTAAAADPLPRVTPAECYTIETNPPVGAHDPEVTVCPPVRG